MMTAGNERKRGPLFMGGEGIEMVCLASSYMSWEAIFNGREAPNYDQ